MRACLLNLCLCRCRIQLGNYLSLLHKRIEVDINSGDGSRRLTANLNGGDSLEYTSSRDAITEVAAFDLCVHVLSGARAIAPESEGSKTDDCHKTNNQD